MKVYFISGLAADRHVFRHIRLPDHCEPVYLDWITPEENEPLQGYAMRLSSKINHDEPFVLVGLSFGGMLAAEIARQYPARATILISSVPASHHLPGYFRLAAMLKLHRVFPITLIQKAAVLKRYFTSETKEDKIMLKNMIRSSDTRFIRWALNAVLTWKNQELPGRLYHLHGSRDGILPCWCTKPTHTISKAGHLMVLTRAEEINAIIKEILSEEENIVQQQVQVR
jgi:pimeloyl-ACP methyl ester carboxylesterase